MKVRFSTAVMSIVKAEGITSAEVAEAVQVLEAAAVGIPRPLHLNQNIEAIRDTNLNWYRLKPKHAAYRIAFSFQRDKDTLVVEGIFRRDATTYQRIAKLYDSSPRKHQP